MSHEIRTLMIGLLGMAGLLPKEPLSAQQREHLQLNGAGRALLAAPGHQFSDRLDEKGDNCLDARVAFKPAEVGKPELLGRPMMSKNRVPT